MHVYSPSDLPKVADFRAYVQRFATIGVFVRVSEMDVDTTDAQLQAKSYADVLAACAAEPTCATFGTWGFADRYSSLQGGYNEWGTGMIFDVGFQPKPAYAQMQNVLR